MPFEVWTIIILGFICVCMFFALRSKNSTIDDKLHEIRDIKNEVEQLKNAILDVDPQVNLENIACPFLNDIRKAVQQKQNDIIEEYNDKYEAKKELYSRLVHLYMVKCQKSEIEVIKEFEDAIAFDYKSLGPTLLDRTKYIASAMADYYLASIKRTEDTLKRMGQKYRSDKIADVRIEAQQLIEKAKAEQYKYARIASEFVKKYPDLVRDELTNNTNKEIKDLLLCCNPDTIQTFTEKINSSEREKDALRAHINQLDNENSNLLSQIESMNKDYQIKCAETNFYLNAFKNKWAYLKNSIEEYKEEYKSNLSAIPYMSRIYADIMTIDFDRLIWSLSWGNNQERQKKVASLLELKKEKSEEIEKIKNSEYQLAYLLELYPALQDVIDAEFGEIKLSFSELTNRDPVENFMSKEEWDKLSVTERNQLALDRYIESRKKSKWQIGRDYELYCGYCYEKQGCNVDYYGSYNGLEDLGRDLIVTQNNDVRIIQCKYWSKTKLIHEKHIMQLYGTVVEYNIEHKTDAKGVLVTNIALSDKAKQFAEVLGIKYKENIEIDEFPRIKCNINTDEFGAKTKIYHLPFDQQYDVTKINGADEFMAMTVREAEKAGFRRAYRWHGYGID